MAAQLVFETAFQTLSKSPELHELMKIEQGIAERLKPRLTPSQLSPSEI